MIAGDDTEGISVTASIYGLLGNKTLADVHRYCIVCHKECIIFLIHDRLTLE